mmetsp:Transcript_24290/g.55411  ORF Transcript_24290/g.55411 Transcript_24290/m.55411 type:complete len:614 (+) Transcript_24290:587-2428(+)
MHVQDGLVPRGDNRTLLQQLQHLHLGLELGHAPPRILHGRAQDKPLPDGILADPTQYAGNVLPDPGVGDLLPGDVHPLDSDLVVGGEDNSLHPGLDLALLHLPCGDNIPHILVPVQQGHAEALGAVAVTYRQVVQQGPQGRPLPPARGVTALFQVVPGQATDWEEFHLLGLELTLGRREERGQLINNGSVPLLGPLHTGVIHLVNRHEELIHPKGAAQDRVLSGLPALLKTSLELSLTGGDNENPNIRLGGSTDHVWHVGLVPRCIQDRESTVRRLEGGPPHLDSLSLGFLLFAAVQDVGQVPAFSGLLLGLPLVLLDLSLVDHPRQQQHVPASGGLTSINMPNKYDVEMGPGIGIFKVFIHIGLLLLANVLVLVRLLGLRLGLGLGLGVRLGSRLGYGFRLLLRRFRGGLVVLPALSRGSLRRSGRWGRLRLGLRHRLRLRLNRLWLHRLRLDRLLGRRCRCGGLSLGLASLGGCSRLLLFLTLVLLHGQGLILSLGLGFGLRSGSPVSTLSPISSVRLSKLLLPLGRSKLLRLLRLRAPLLLLRGPLLLLLRVPLLPAPALLGLPVAAFAVAAVHLLLLLPLLLLPLLPLLLLLGVPLLALPAAAVSVHDN